MRRGVTFCMTTLFFLVVTITSSTLGQDLYGASIEVIGQREFHFDVVRPGKDVEHTFTLKNTGNNIIQVKPARVKGPLTNIKIKEKISPGQEGKITLRLDTTKFYGDIETEITLQTNDPKQPTIKLKMAGKIEAAIEFQPFPVVFLSAFKGEVKERSLTIINNEEKPLEIFGLESESKRFQADLATLKKGKKYKLTVKTDPLATPGRAVEPVLLFTNHPEFPEIKLPVNLFIKDDVYTFPDNINFEKIHLKKLKEHLKKSPQAALLITETIFVKRKPEKGKDFQIRLEHDIPYIKIKKEPESNSDTYKLEITPILEKMKPGKINTFILVKTNDKEVPELKIPVVGEVL